MVPLIRLEHIVFHDEHIGKVCQAWIVVENVVEQLKICDF